jgi:AcrR family transcriptional regulator
MKSRAQGGLGALPSTSSLWLWIATSIACRYLVHRYLVHKKFSEYSCIFFSVQLLYKYHFMILFFIGGWEDMARKAYSEEDRVQVRNALMTTMIQCIADRGLIHSSIDVLCRKVGISKTFFYSFFSSKEELVLYALRYQQPKLLDYARSLMEDPGLSWRAGVETFLKNCCYGAKSGVAVLSIEEEQQVRHCLSEENFQAFRRDQIIFYGKLLSIFSLPVDSIDPRLFGNLALSMMMVHKAIPDTMPFLFPEVAEDMVDFQVRALVDEMERVKEHVR